MKDRDKLPIIIKHWIEHNETHIDEYRRWGQTAGELGLQGIQAKIADATNKLSESNSHLQQALKELQSL